MKVTHVTTYPGPEATDGRARRILRATVELDDGRQEVVDVVVRGSAPVADTVVMQVRSALAGK